MIQASRAPAGAAVPMPPPPPTANPAVDPSLAAHPLAQITKPLLHHMNGTDGLNGYTFARWLIDSDPSGRQNYDIMKEAGRDQLMEIIKTYPPLYDVIEKVPAKFSAFLTEFLRFDEWQKEQDAMEDGEDTGT